MLALFSTSHVGQHVLQHQSFVGRYLPISHEKRQQPKLALLLSGIGDTVVRPDAARQGGQQQAKAAQASRTNAAHGGPQRREQASRGPGLLLVLIVAW